MLRSHSLTLLLAAASAAMLTACASGGATEETDTTPDDGTTTATSGGETIEADAGPDDVDGNAGGVDDAPRGAALLALPTMPVPRSELSEPLQILLVAAEDAAALEPPGFDDLAVGHAITQEEMGAFADEIRRYVEALAVHVRTMIEQLPQLESAPDYERLVASTVVGYTYDGALRTLAGAPVPEVIASDPELLAIYESSLREAIAPLAQYAVQFYGVCVNIAREFDDEDWYEWGLACDERGLAIEEELAAPAAE